MCDTAGSKTLLFLLKMVLPATGFRWYLRHRQLQFAVKDHNLAFTWWETYLKIQCLEWSSFESPMLISKLLSSIVICTGSAVTSVHCSLKALNKTYVPITCVVSAQCLSSPEAIFLLYCPQLQCLAKVKERRIFWADPERDRLGSD